MHQFILFLLVVAAVLAPLYLLSGVFFGARGGGAEGRKPDNVLPFEAPRRGAARPEPAKPFGKASERTARAPSAEVLEGRARVIDGDTIAIGKTNVRLFGIDAPEMGHPFGRKAKWALVSLCKNQTVRAEIEERDSYGRAVAKCRLPDGRDLSAEMVRRGLAIDWPKFSGGAYRALEPSGIRKKLWLADARQKGRMHVWRAFEARQGGRDGAGTA